MTETIRFLIDDVLEFHRFLEKNFVMSGGIRDMGLLLSHPFVDGNKRTACHSMLVFLQSNGIILEYDEDDLCDLIVGIAEGRIDDQKLLHWLESHKSER